MNDAVVNAQILRAATVAVRDCSEPPLQIGFRGFVAGMTINVGVRERPQPVVDTAVNVQHLHVALERSEERRVGKECVSPCRSRWSPDHSKKKKRNKYKE